MVLIIAITWQFGLLKSSTSKPNEPPTARITTSTIDTYQRVAVNFSGLTSTDPEKKSLSYSWNFDDGEQSTHPAPQHKFNSVQTYHIKLTVTDDKGDIGIATVDVNVKNALEMKAQLKDSYQSWGTWYINIDVTTTNYGGEEIQLSEYGNMVWTLYTREGDTYTDDGTSVLLKPGETKTTNLYYTMSTQHNSTKISYNKGIYQQVSIIPK